MTNLSNNVSMEKSKTAWENFKSFLESMEMNTGKTVEMAFKKGFNEGFELNKKELEAVTKEYEELLKNNLVQAAISETKKLEKVKGPSLKNNPDYDKMVVGTINLNTKAWKLEEKPEVIIPLKPTLPAEPEKPKKTGIKRNIITRTIRSANERKLDGECAVEILREAGREMALQEIIKAAHEKGRKWPYNSASGYMIKAIEDGYNIERAGYGFYKYKGEVL